MQPSEVRERERFVVSLERFVPFGGMPKASAAECGPAPHETSMAVGNGFTVARRIVAYYLKQSSAIG